MQLHHKDPNLLKAIISRMISENIKNFSEQEVYRTIAPCVSGHRLIPIVREMTASNKLTLDMVIMKGNERTGKKHDKTI